MPSFPKASPIHFEAIVATMKGTMYCSPPVTSNIITTRETVILVTPPKAAAGPTIEYNPGSMHEVGSAQTPSQIGDDGKASIIFWVIIPISRPKII